MTVGDPAVAVLGQPSAPAIKTAIATMGVRRCLPTPRDAARRANVSPQDIPPTRHARSLPEGSRIYELARASIPSIQASGT